MGYSVLKVIFRHLLVLGIAVSAATSYASIKKRSYPATEEGPSEEVISSAPGYRGQATEETTNPSGIVTEEPASEAPQQRLPAPPPPQSEVVTSQCAYDQVPASQVEPLVRRLQIVESLVTKYGRAYDYRALTVTQLEALLGQLDTQAAEAAELRRRMESRVELKKQVREEENSSDNSIGSEAPEEPIPPPSQ